MFGAQRSCHARYPACMTIPRRLRFAAGAFPIFAAVLLAACGSVPAARETAESPLVVNAAEPAHLHLARELVLTVPPENTRYQHKPSVVEACSGDQPARVLTDCSGLLNTLLARSLRLDDAELGVWLRARRPLAKHYFTAISRGRGFALVADVRDIRAGDILAVRFPADNDNSGHTMIADGSALPREESPPLVEGLCQWMLPIIDSTSSPHGPDDTRARPRRTGLGRGTMRLYSDASGAIVGYTWSTKRGSEFCSRDDRPLVVGRVSFEAVRTLVEAGRKD